jgi:hypothetical protein
MVARRVLTIPQGVASWDAILQLRLSWEDLPVGKEESLYRHGRNGDKPQRFVNVTKPASVEDCATHQEDRYEPQGVPSPLFYIGDLDDLIQCFFWHSKTVTGLTE